MTTANPQRQCNLHRKFSTEVRPPPLRRRDERIRSMTCSFEEIAESEEEDIQVSLPEARLEPLWGLKITMVVRRKNLANFRFRVKYFCA